MFNCMQKNHFRNFGNNDCSHQKSQFTFLGNFHAYMHAKINFITHFFLKTLLRNNKLAILSNLGMPGYTHTHTLKVILSNCRKCLYLSAEKKQASSNDCWSSSETVDSFISFIKWLLDFRYCTCFKQGVPWHSGNYRL